MTTATTDWAETTERAQTRPEIRTVSGRRMEPLEGLTPAERRVADLAAFGLTNREVASDLNLSPHTVDYHLRQIYRKLGITSRVRLARAVVEQTQR
jgi:DNA-binding CsgD family transcriptional regulator